MKRTKPQKHDEWKVEPVPATAKSVADLSSAELLTVLQAAYRRIHALEAELGRAAV